MFVVGNCNDEISTSIPVDGLWYIWTCLRMIWFWMNV